MFISTRIRIRRSYTTSYIPYTQTINHPSIQQPHNATQFNMFQINTELKSLVKSGNLSHARQVFDELPHRDEVTWTTIISGYVKSSDPSEALSLFSAMWAWPSQRMDPFILSLALKACGIIYSSKRGESLHGYCVKTDFVSSVFVGSALLDMYMKTGKVNEGCRVFNEMPIRNVVSWTAVITGLVRAGFNMEGISYFANLCRNNMTYDSYTLAIALKACADACLIHTGKEIHAQTLKKGFETTSFVVNTLTTMYSKCGKADYALYLFEKITTKDVVSWTTIITSYVQTGQDFQAVEAFLRMRESEVVPNEYTLAAVISSCANIGNFDLGQQLHGHVLVNGLLSCMSVGNSIMTMYSKCGMLSLSSIAFDEMTEKDIVSWSTVIGGYAQGGFGEEAFKYLSLMRKDGPKPNEFAYSSVLSVCGNMAILEQGKQVHTHCIRVGLDHTAMVRSGLINMYSKCGCVNESLNIFNKAKHNDIVSWTAMINGYAEHGSSQEAIDLFEQLVKVGLTPDTVTFIGVLTACSHAGLVDRGFHYFNQITNYKLKVSKEHYGCMIDLLCRAGWLLEAENMIANMPYNVDDVVWSTLLRACRLHGDVDLGAHAAKRILEMDPNCASTHITLANLYSVKGKWREAAEVRRLMRIKGVIKEPGWSWIKIKDCVFAFAAGDHSNPQWEDMCCILGLLSLKEQVFANGESVLIYNNVDEVEEEFC
ncbi:putative pentatricopeptide repeat-containing protein At3g47840 [Bidens hawaiensis]|uniref:putative pentatricopeptide repeat-containing protein At3g47840 n=1 Tax=Bidens hawaiensis TaxID=980011 RepID=UPI00404A7D6A